MLVTGKLRYSVCGNQSGGSHGSEIPRGSPQVTQLVYGRKWAVVRRFDRGLGD